MVNNRQIIILDSPIEFMLIGTIENKRIVLAKSSEARVDLKSYSSVTYFFEKKKVRKKNKLEELFYLKNIELEPLKVDSNVFLFIDKDEDFFKNKRLDNLTFVWRGLASEADKEVIESLFDERSYSIVQSYYYQDIEQLEWDVSDIISVCSFALDDRKNLLIKKKRFFQIFMSIYILMFFLMILLSFIKIAFKV
ncbi:hypothetical protein [Acinetobacter baumannii]|uniref:hypothetical protein n=1 Tax=Acinetobacter baumannii TaxID=470 RepID=UPI00044F7F47|nr:hypothetical protein [Acinetobacter baumannii]EXD15358.1 hypothetical protein J479_2461 [Acinetobacter baumannii 1297]MCX2995585.1 hypothetical protein [Acinetobacter baumannii]MDV7412803.1 hypothetical protein [Acinetobacter baumannii]TPU03750.1 hypothetical protein FJV00_15890 [Acinetobacter baumannii]HCA5040197.1 hypothetical protein [Acinetobacter baumannii]